MDYEEDYYGSIDEWNDDEEIYEAETYLNICTGPYPSNPVSINR